MATVKKRKFKGIKKKQRKKLPSNPQIITVKKPQVQFPKISRFITEKVVVIAAVVLMVFLGIAWEASLASSLQHQEAVVVQNRRKLTDEVKKWQAAIVKYPDYRDGYFKLALLEYQLRNKKEAIGYINKTLQLDPNFKSAQKLQQILK